MADPITITETVTTGWSPAEAQERVVAAFGRKVRRNEPGWVLVRTGSQFAIRMLGAYLIPRRWMPARITIEFSASNGGCRATIACSDDFGWGFRAGMRRRYEGLLEEKLAQVRDVLSGATPLE